MWKQNFISFSLPSRLVDVTHFFMLCEATETTQTFHFLPWTNTTQTSFYFEIAQHSNQMCEAENICPQLQHIGCLATKATV